MSHDTQLDDVEFEVIAPAKSFFHPLPSEQEFDTLVGYVNSLSTPELHAVNAEWMRQNKVLQQILSTMHDTFDALSVTPNPLSLRKAAEFAFKAGFSFGWATRDGVDALKSQSEVNDGAGI